GKENEKDGRWEGKADPGRQRAQRPRPHQTQRKADLARGRPRQELTQRHKIGIACLAQPAPPRHEFIAKITKMGDRPAKAGQTELEKGRKDHGRIATHRPHILAHALASAYFCSTTSLSISIV